MARQTCQFCGRKVGADNLVEARDPFDSYKIKWVCADSDTCAAAGRANPGPVSVTPDDREPAA